MCISPPLSFLPGLLISNVRAFEYTAQTIFQVGQQSVITSLMRSESNALRIESCNEALTELISLFTVRDFTLLILPW